MNRRSILLVANVIASGLLGLIVFREMMKSGKQWREEWEERKKQG